MFKVNNKDTTRVYIVIPFSRVSIVDFEQVFDCWISLPHKAIHELKF